MPDRFDADTAALARREVLNQAAARFNLDTWIIGHVRPAPGHRVLDLGCGRGKQIFALAPLVLPGGTVLGLDISPDAVAEVHRRAAAEGRAHVSARVADLDTCLAEASGRTFDRILSTYAVYYARDMIGLMIELRGNLAPGGFAFHCGFARGTNQEMIDIINRAGAAADAGLAGGGAGRASAHIDDFISSEQIERLRATYARVQVVRLENRLTFSSADAVTHWWENHNSYRPELAEPVRRAVGAVVDSCGVFSLTKNVVGVLLHV